MSAWGCSLCAWSLGFWLGLRPHGHPTAPPSQLPDAAPPAAPPARTGHQRGARGSPCGAWGQRGLSCVAPRAGQAPHRGLPWPGRSFGPSQPSQSLWSFSSAWQRLMPHPSPGMPLSSPSLLAKQDPPACAARNPRKQRAVGGREAAAVATQHMQALRAALLSVKWPRTPTTDWSERGPGRKPDAGGYGQHRAGHRLRPERAPRWCWWRAGGRPRRWAGRTGGCRRVWRPDRIRSECAGTRLSARAPWRR